MNQTSRHPWGVAGACDEAEGTGSSRIRVRSCDWLAQEEVCKCPRRHGGRPGVEDRDVIDKRNRDHGIVQEVSIREGVEDPVAGPHRKLLRARRTPGKANAGCPVILRRRYRLRKADIVGIKKAIAEERQELRRERLSVGRDSTRDHNLSALQIETASRFTN